MTSENHNIIGQKFFWRKNKNDFNEIKQISLSTGFSLPISEVLLSRGYKNKKDILNFLFPEEPVALAFELKDGAKTIARILQAIEKQEKILVFGDYDVDGMTATSIGILGLKKLGANVNYYLPHRVFDGYGLSPKIIQKAFDNGFKVVITVDNGTTSHDAAKLSLELGIDLIITDHHQPKDELPKSFALVNPHQEECKYPFKNFCGAGVIFKIIQTLFKSKNIDIPLKIYELLLLGTVADVVQLHGENRYWVNFALKLLETNKPSFAFMCLAENAKKKDKKKWTSSDIGFGLAPQLNALGRLDDPRTAIKFLIGSDQNEVLEIAKNLLELNDKRRAIEAEVLEKINIKIKNKEINVETEKILFAADSTWPPGVIGLAAGRLTGNYGRPSFIFHIDKNGIAKGSARSIPGFNLFAELEKNSDILKTYGGHKQAAGLSLLAENLPILKKNLEQQISEQFEIKDLIPAIFIDADLSLLDLNKRFLDDFERMEPFGNENASPTFITEKLILTKLPTIINEKHVKLQVFGNDTTKPVIFFNRPELLELFINQKDKPFDLAVQILLNDFSGVTQLELQGIDVRF